MKHWNATHGDYGSTEYRSWIKMLGRCYNPNFTRFERWGGRGICVCDRWRHDFAAFLADMGRKPNPSDQLDRIDNDGNYEPGNCRWASVREQSRNRRSNINITFNGRTQCSEDWAREVGIDGTTLRWRIRKGWPLERALNVHA